MTDSNSPARRAKRRNTRLEQWLGQAQMSFQDMAVELRRMAVAEGRPELARGRTRIAHWVSGGDLPREPIPTYVARILTRKCRLGTALTPEDLGMGPSERPPGGKPGIPVSPAAAPDEEGDPTNRRTAVSLIGAALLPHAASADTVRAYTRHATSSELVPGDAEDLEYAVHRIGAGYSAASPQELWPVVASYRQRAFSLLTRRHTLREGRELANHAGMLSVILAWIAHDLGERDLVNVLCADAWEQGRQADALEVGAWAEDVRATDALYNGRPLDALASATPGLAVAPRNSNAAIRLAAQTARAQARLGDRSAYAQAAALANHYREKLPLHASGLFAVDSVRLTSYEASSWGWLGDHTQARTAAAQAIEHYMAMPAPYQAPTRLAIARLDLASAHAELGEPDAAIAAARQALVGKRPVQSIHNRLKQLERKLKTRYPTLPITQAFSEEAKTLTT